MWPSPPAGQLTTWGWDPATGLLVSKTDAEDQSVLYEYTPDGRLKQRTWAREVVTEYDYYDEAPRFTGELKDVTYSDDTVDVNYIYRRSGQPFQEKAKGDITHFGLPQACGRSGPKTLTWS